MWLKMVHGNAPGDRASLKNFSGIKPGKRRFLGSVGREFSHIPIGIELFSLNSCEIPTFQK